MWKLMIADDQDHHTVVNLVREQYTVGRSEGHSVCLTERNISRNHAKISRSGTCYRIEDLSSYNGLYINGLRLVGRQDLAHGDLIQLGDYRINVVDEAIDTQEQGYRGLPGSSRPPASSRLPHRLVELIGPNQGAEFSLDGERFLLGRGAECEFTIDHGSVSRIHAEVRSIGKGRFEILDKGSANGLRVNGHPMSKAILDSRDVVELGDVVLKYIPKGQEFQANAREGSRIAAMAGSAPPPAAGSRAPTGVLSSLFAAVLGALVVGVIVTTLLSKKASKAPGELPREIAGAAVDLEQGRLVIVAEKLDKIDDATRVLSSYRDLEKKWAEAVVNHHSSDDQQRLLLDLVAKKESLPAAIREAALKRLTSLSEGAIDLGSLENGSEGGEP